MQGWQKTQDNFYSDAGKHTHLHYHPQSVYGRDLAGRMASALSLSPEDRVLEIGCGSGRFTLHLLKLCGGVTGLDASSALIDELRRLAGANSRLSALTGDAYQLSQALKPGSVNAVCGFFILHHLLDHPALFKSVFDVLPQGGRIGFLEPNRANPLFLLQVLFSREMTWAAEKGMFTFSARRTAALFEKAGFADVRLQRCGFFPPQILDRVPPAYAVQRGIERFPPVRRLLPFSLITAVKP